MNDLVCTCGPDGSTFEPDCPVHGALDELDYTNVVEYPLWYKDGSRNRRRGRVKGEVARMLYHLDPDPLRQGLDDTPDRVARMYVDELCAGYEVDVQGLFRTFDADNFGGMVIVRDVPVTSLCEHHLVPFIGYAHVGYLPDGKVVGLSKIARVVEAYSRRLQIQERLTYEITQAIQDNLAPRGVMVVLEAEHMCMTIRGVQKPGTRTVTSDVRGVFESNGDGEKDEFLRLIGK